MRRITKSSRTPFSSFRRLEVSVAGRWFLGLTVLLGIVALVSGNNVLYLTESLLLSGLILSGILSERAISAVEVTVHRLPASAGEPARDRIMIRNRKRVPLFCLEILEWKGRRSTVIAFVPRLGAREEAVLASSQLFERRGLHHWEGLGVATSAPFGFARKLKLWRDPGQRRIWPARAPSSDPYWNAERRRTRLAGGDVSEGEVRPFVIEEDDPRLIVWQLSARGGEPVVRQRRSQSDLADPRLDLRVPPGPEFEQAVLRTAQTFYGERGDLPEARARTLTLVGAQGTRKIVGQARALDELATVEPEGGPR